MNRKRVIASLVGVILGAYLLFSLAWISLPGPDADEVLFVEVWYRDSSIATSVDHFRTFHRNFETMIGTYNGAVKGWLWWLFFAAGRSVYTLRIPAVLLGAVALLLFYGWARRLYPPGTVLVALLLAATDPVYINTSRIDYGPVVLQRLLLMAGLLAGTKFVLAGPGVRGVGTVPGDGGIPAGVPGDGPGRRGRLPHGSYGWLVLAGFCFGLALWDKATFAWCLMALSAALLILFPKEVLRRLRPLPIVVFLFFFCLGSLPLTAFNLRTKTRGTREVMHWESLDAKTCNLKWANFRLSFDGYYTYGMMGGDAFDEGVVTVYDRTQWCLDALGWFAPKRGTLFTWVLAATMLIGVAAAWRRQRAVLFPLVLSLVHWLAVFVTEGAGGPHHTTLIYPIPHLAFAAAGAWLWQGSGRLPGAAAWVARRGLVLALAAVVMVQLAFDARQLSSFRQVRGTRIWSDAIYDLAGYLKANPPGLLVNMDWGFGFPLLLLTDDAVRQNEFYGRIAFEDGDPADKIGTLLPLLSRPNTLFLTHTDPFLGFPATKTVFERALAQAGKRARVVRRFYQADGQPLAQLIRVE